jgi:hypothetical protein
MFPGVVGRKAGGRSPNKPHWFYAERGPQGACLLPNSGAVGATAPKEHTRAKGCDQRGRLPHLEGAQLAVGLLAVLAGGVDGLLARTVWGCVVVSSNEGFRGLEHKCRLDWQPEPSAVCGAVARGPRDAGRGPASASRGRNAPQSPSRRVAHLGGGKVGDVLGEGGLVLAHVSADAQVAFLGGGRLCAGLGLGAGSVWGREKG